MKQISSIGGGPMYNPEACKYFDRLGKRRGWKLQHALNGGEVSCVGYSLDAYDKRKNIIVEYDEPKHEYQRWKQKDLERLKNLINNLKCRVFRYSEKYNVLYESFPEYSVKIN